MTITGRGDLDPNQNFWHYGGEKLIYTTNAAAAKLSSEFTDLAEIVPIGDSIDGFGQIVDDLGRRGVNRLMVEGGSSIHTAFLSQGLVDEIHLAIAPLVVGQAAAPRFLDPAVYPGGPTRRMRLLGTEAIDDVVLLRYAPKHGVDTD